MKKGSDSNSKLDLEVSFVEWNVKAPLEVIYEAYEREGEDEGDDNENYHNFDLPRLPLLKGSIHGSRFGLMYMF